jgi:hypothetical protein
VAKYKITATVPIEFEFEQVDGPANLMGDVAQALMTFERGVITFFTGLAADPRPLHVGETPVTVRSGVRRDPESGEIELVDPPKGWPYTSYAVERDGSLLFEREVYKK